jgi:CDP-diacylglycerol--glycerol-3-phosphate 3-phosphatidyltransferase
MGIYGIKPKFQRTLRPIENLLVRYKVHPTWINLFGLVMAIVAAAAILGSQHNKWLLLLVPIAANARTACNALDGLVARRLGVADHFGEVLNETIDRVSDSTIFIALYFLSATDDRLALFTLVIILINSYLSIVSKAAGGSRQYGGIMGKADRMIYVSVFAVAVLIFGDTQLWNTFLWFTLAGTAITFIQRFNTTYQELRKLDGKS